MANENSTKIEGSSKKIAMKIREIETADTLAAIDLRAEMDWARTLDSEEQEIHTTLSEALELAAFRAALSGDIPRARSLMNAASFGEE